MYWVTAVVFTCFGFFVGVEKSKNIIIGITIDTLIKEGYLKARGHGKDKELIKYDEPL